MRLFKDLTPPPDWIDYLLFALIILAACIIGPAQQLQKAWHEYRRGRNPSEKNFI